MSPRPLPRRSFLKAAGLAAGAMTACGLGPPLPQEPVLRLAHLTDMHVLPYAGAMEGFALALRSLRALQPPVDAVINTGDCIMDALAASQEDALAQWRAFRQVLEQECSLPVYHCIGNHDVWGWGLDDPRIRSDPLYGKGMALSQLGLAQRYYSFDLGGWHFIVLDSTHPRLSPESTEPYIGLLDREQFDWLASDLAQTPDATPICLISHIPILAACELLDGSNECRNRQCNNSLYQENYADNWTLPGAWVHIDARRMRRLFLQHRNVRLCLSGHAHQVERLEYLGVTFLCDGAVSGNWWRGPYMDFPPGYAILTLYADGSALEQFIAYGET